MREYEDRHEIDKIYEGAKKRIKEQIKLKGVSCKGSAKGTAISEIISVLDKELEIGIAEELCTARRMCREYYKKYADVESLERRQRDAEEKIKIQEQTVDLVSHLTDEVLKNAILAYNAIESKDRYGRYGNKEDAKAIAIAYINSKGREDLKDSLEVGK